MSVISALGKTYVCILTGSSLYVYNVLIFIDGTQYLQRGCSLLCAHRLDEETGCVEQDGREHAANDNNNNNNNKRHSSRTDCYCLFGSLNDIPPFFVSFSALLGD